jgi:hypothetical protein
MKEVTTKGNLVALTDGKNAPITFNIQSNEDVIETMNHVLNLYVTGQITDRQLKALTYPMQIFQTSLKTRDVEGKLKTLFKQIEQLKAVK